MDIEKKTAFDRLLQKLFGEKYDTLDMRRKLTVANIRALCTKNECKKMCIMSTLTLNNKEKENIEFLQEQLKNDEIEVEFVGNVMENVSGFDKLVETGVAVLLEKTKETRYVTMNQIVSVCEEHQINVLGVICQ